MSNIFDLQASARSVWGRFKNKTPEFLVIGSCYEKPKGTVRVLGTEGYVFLLLGNYLNQEIIGHLSALPEPFVLNGPLEYAFKNFVAATNGKSSEDVLFWMTVLMDVGGYEFFEGMDFTKEQAKLLVEASMDPGVPPDVIKGMVLDKIEQRVIDWVSSRPYALIVPRSQKMEHCSSVALFSFGGVTSMSPSFPEEHAIWPKKVTSLETNRNLMLHLFKDNITSEHVHTDKLKIFNGTKYSAGVSANLKIAVQFDQVTDSILEGITALGMRTDSPHHSSWAADKGLVDYRKV